MKQLVVLIFVAIASTGVSFAQKVWRSSAATENPVIVKFFPNPAITTLNFEFKLPVERGAMLEVFSFLGRKMAALPVNSQRLVLNVTDFYKGIYVFQLVSPNGKVLETNKFQVIH